MEEKKNRFRPSLTAYRALENENSLLKEENAKLKSVSEIPEIVRITNEQLTTENKSLREKKETLERSNKLMEDELARLREANYELSKMNKQLSRECQYLQSRGFWKRLFNIM